MADEILPTTTVTEPVDQTGPLDAGHTTTEFYITKIVTVLSSVAAVLGFGMDILTKAQVLLPTTTWLNGVLVIGGIAGAVISNVVYTLSRYGIKKAALVFPQPTIVPPGPGTALDKAVNRLDQ